MKNLIHPILALLLCIPFDAISQTPPTLPPDLSRIVIQHARQHADAITKLNAITIKALDALKIQYMRSANLDAANKTQAKIDELKTEAQGVANEATPPIGASPQSGLYTDTHDGTAGSAKTTNRNTYQFDVKLTGKAKILVTSTKPASSAGEVQLINGEKTVVLGTWDSAKEAAWPLQYEAQLTTPGRYEVRFLFRGGRESLGIRAVKIDMRVQ